MPRCGRPARRAVSRPVCANEKNPALSVDRKLFGTSTIGSHPARSAPAVAPHDPPLLTTWEFSRHGRPVQRRIAGGLLAHWGVWTRRAVEQLERIKEARSGSELAADWLAEAVAVTDMNAAVFDAANGFRGCIPGILEVLRRQGLAPSACCLDPHETLSPGQAEELDRVTAAYPQLVDDDFVAAHRDRWLG